MLFNNILYCDENYTVRRGYVAVRDGRVSYVGEAPPAPNGAALGTNGAAGGKESGWPPVIDGENRLLLPGFVNAHCHVPMTLLRGYGEGLPLQRWLNERVFPFEDRMTADDMYWGSLVGIAEMLASGVTSFTEMYGPVEPIPRAVELAGIKANISRAITSFDGGDLNDSERHAEALALIDGWNGKCGGRIIADAALHAEYTSHEKIVRHLAEFAVSRGLNIHVHCSETRSEHDNCVKERGMTPAAYFEQCGLFEPRVTAAHCVWATDADIEIFTRNGVTVAHCPSSNMKLGSGTAPVPDMLARGVNVALGTDGASSNNNLNMLEEAHVAALIHRGFKQNPELLPPETILRMASRNGALAQGREDCGLIKEGFRADFAVLRTDKPHLTPSHDALAAVVFAAQGSDVEMTVVDGEIVYRDGQFLRFDIDEAMKKAAEAAARIANELL